MRVHMEEESQPGSMLELVLSLGRRALGSSPACLFFLSLTSPRLSRPACKPQSLKSQSVVFLALGLLLGAPLPSNNPTGSIGLWPASTDSHL